MTRKYRKHRATGATIPEYAMLIARIALLAVPGIPKMTESFFHPLCMAGGAISYGDDVSTPLANGVTDGVYSLFHFGDYGGRTHHFTRCSVKIFRDGKMIVHIKLWGTW